MYNNDTCAYYDKLYYNLQNLRFAENTTAKPVTIIHPQSVDQIRQVISCSKSSNLQLRIRSNGHSYEGLSSTADASFVIMDLSKYNKVEVSLETSTARVQAGATLGEVYYHINKQSDGKYGFSAGSCPTVGSGGHFSGGGYGLMSRQYGLAADNIVDVTLVDYLGNVWTKETMSEDLFWSLRGGGGGSFGIVAEWVIDILPVPSVVTVFNKVSNGSEAAAGLVQKWQTVGPYAPKSLYMSVYISGINSSTTQHRHPLTTGDDVADSIQAIFHGQSLLPAQETLDMIKSLFPELDLAESDLNEMSWIESIVYFSGLSANATTEDLLNRFNPSKGHFKAKSDYVQEPMSLEGIRTAFSFLQVNPTGYILFDPYGGMMWEVPADAIPFPHRAGNLYSIQYQTVWNTTSDDAKHMAWLRDFYAAMEPYVSKNPRASYVNYLDLDLGTANNGTTNVSDGSGWGHSYFSADNYRRLVETKTTIDPQNFFRNAQSIPIDS